MSHSPDPANSPYSWYYPPTGPTPPTPVVVDAVPDYFGSRPTPPPSPLKLRATPTVDDYTHCPSTPYCVSSCLQNEGMQCSIALSGATSHSTPPEYPCTSELNQTTVFEDPLADQAQYDVAPHVSYCRTYDRERYASSPILRMTERTTLDSKGLKAECVNAWPGDLPRAIRPNTCHIPVADHESFDYHNNSLPSTSLERDHHCFSIGTIQDLQHNLRVRWRSVNPRPIPPVIVRLHDLVKPCSLRRREEGYTFVVPTEGGIWDTIYQRGIDSNFWPICSSTVVDPQGDEHNVASKFAVNIFLELPHSTGSIRCCEYLGAYLLEVEGVLTISATEHSFRDSLYLPYVRFNYYMWDESTIRLANKLCSPSIVEPSPGITPNSAGHGNGDPDDFRHCTDQYRDVGQDIPSTPRAHSGRARLPLFS